MSCPFSVPTPSMADTSLQSSLCACLLNQVGSSSWQFGSCSSVYTLVTTRARHTVGGWMQGLVWSGSRVYVRVRGGPSTPGKRREAKPQSTVGPDSVPAEASTTCPRSSRSPWVPPRGNSPEPLEGHRAPLHPEIWREIYFFSKDMGLDPFT